MNKKSESLLGAGVVRRVRKGLDGFRTVAIVVIVALTSLMTVGASPAAAQDSNSDVDLYDLALGFAIGGTGSGFETATRCPTEFRNLSPGIEVPIGLDGWGRMTLTSNTDTASDGYILCSKSGSNKGALAIYKTGICTSTLSLETPDGIRAGESHASNYAGWLVNLPFQGKVMAPGTVQEIDISTYGTIEVDLACNTFLSDIRQGLGLVDPKLGPAASAMTGLASTSYECVRTGLLDHPEFAGGNCSAQITRWLIDVAGMSANDAGKVTANAKNLSRYLILVGAFVDKLGTGVENISSAVTGPSTIKVQLRTARPRPTPPAPVHMCEGKRATIIGTNASETLNGTAGVDVIVGLGGNDTIRGHNGDDIICGGDGHDTILGDAGNDLIVGGSGNDEILGGYGHDILAGRSGNDTITGQTGNDRLYGDAGLDKLYGSAGNDRIFGGADADALYGSSGNDHLDGGTWNDHLDGGTGNDTLLGGAGSDYLSGWHGTDVLRGGAGNDRLTGGNNNDDLRGGSGNDHLWGGNGNDRLHGDAGADRIWGNWGQDVLVGGTGNDHLDGGQNNDTLWGNDGDDYLYGHTGIDNLNGERGRNDRCVTGERLTGCENGINQLHNTIVEITGTGRSVNPSFLVWQGQLYHIGGSADYWQCHRQTGGRVTKKAITSVNSFGWTLNWHSHIDRCW